MATVYLSQWLSTVASTVAIKEKSCEALHYYCISTACILVGTTVE
jgi:hypothetical protein